MKKSADTTKPQPDNPEVETPVNSSLEASSATAEPISTPETQTVEPVSESNPEPDATTALAELTNDLQRTRADFENYRKQVEAQKSQAMSAARLATVTKFLPLVDDFERAITAYPEQLSPLQKSFEKTLKTLGLAKIDSNPGTEFNPDLHEAVSVDDGDGTTEVISETLRPGYLYDSSVLRAAMVKVTRK